MRCTENFADYRAFATDLHSLTIEMGQLMNRPKRLLSGLIILILIVVIPLAPGGAGVIAADSPTADHMIRVHLSSYGAPASVTLNAAGNHTVSDNGKSISGLMTLSVVNGGIRIAAGTQTWDLDSDVTISAANLSVSHLLTINSGHSYAGDLRFIVKGSGLKIINHIDYETYVMGVLPYEMSNSWPLEALKAQAVAARSFAYFEANSRNRTAVEHDVVNTTASQVYYGYNPANARCIEAVKATSKQILQTADNKNVITCFSASNGGWTEYPAASGATATNFSYLPYKEDPYDLRFALSGTSYSAQVIIPKTLSADNLKSSSNQPYAMIRAALQARGIDPVALTSDVAVTAINLTTPRYLNPERCFTGADITLELSATNVSPASQMTVSFPAYVDSKGVKRPFLNNVLGLADKSKFSRLFLRDDAGYFLLAAVRYGHAAGMSQIGAYQMSSEGKVYTDILAFYYEMGKETKLITKAWNLDTNIPVTNPPDSAAPQSGTVDITSGTLNVRSGPGTNYSVIGSLKKGAAVTITGSTGAWFSISFSGKTGYVSTQFIKVTANIPTPSNPTTPPNTTPPAQTPPASTPPAQTPATPSVQTGTVNITSGTLNIRSGPGTNYSVIGSLNKGAAVTITGSTGSWFSISINGKTGYVSYSYIRLSSSAPATSKTGTVNVSSGTLNVRSGPGTGYSVVGSLKKGNQVTITGTAGSWYQIQFSGTTAYVSTSYVKL